MPKRRKASRQVDTNNTRKALEKRRALLTHPLVTAELDRLWNAANFNDEDAVLDQSEYYTMHRKMVLAISPDLVPKDAFSSAKEDFLRDSSGHEDGGLDRARFNECWQRVDSRTLRQVGPSSQPPVTLSMRV